MENKKILVIDDESHIVRVIAAKLQNNGFDVSTTDNGEDAYKICCNQKPNLIVADFQMPCMTGIELAEKLHKKPQFSDIPVIILAAKDFEFNDGQLEKAGITECLNKPFSPKELLACVENVLASSAAN